MSPKQDEIHVLDYTASQCLFLTNNNYYLFKISNFKSTHLHFTNSIPLGLIQQRRGRGGAKKNIWRTVVNLSYLFTRDCLNPLNFLWQNKTKLNDLRTAHYKHFAAFDDCM